MNAAAVVAHFKYIGQLFSALTVLNLVGHQWPKHARVSDGDTFDFIIVGAGTAGCVIANRLIEIGNVTVLLIEAGDDPPFETEIPNLMLYLKNTRIDWNFTSKSYDDSMPFHRNRVIEMTQGKMIGGTGSLNYMGYLRGNKYDYDNWAKITNDSSWSWKSVKPAFHKNEQLTDKRILSTFDKYSYGRQGKIKLRKQYFKRNNNYFKALRELGWNTPLDINPENPFGFSNVMNNIGDNKRQSTALKFLSPIKKHPNLYVMKNTLATKIIINDHKKAVGVEIVTSKNRTLRLQANKEVIISAGTIKSPQLLMLSGIGPIEHLRSKGIKCKVNLPVGQNFQDHVNSHLVYKLPKVKREGLQANPYKYPYTIFEGLVALNQSQKYPDYEVVGVSFGQKEPFLGLCAFYFNFEEKLCDMLYAEIDNNELLLTMLTHLYPKSRGEISLASTNPHDHPIINAGYYSNPIDIINHSKYLKDFNRILKTSFFKSIDAKLVAPDLSHCKFYKRYDDKYWECFTLTMSDTSHYYTSTCAMGTVLDSKLRVRGVKNLRVIDASSFPDTIGAPIFATVVMLAQKGVEFVIQDLIDIKIFEHNI